MYGQKNIKTFEVLAAVLSDDALLSGK